MKTLLARLGLWSLLFVLGWPAVGLAAGPAADESALSTIKVGGSSNVEPLMMRWVEALVEIEPDLVVSVDAQGTAEGIEALKDGSIDVAMASRPAEPEEMAGLRAQGHTVRETVVAHMGIAVVVNSRNPVTSLTFSQLADIFSGEAKRWSSFGGPDEPILLVRKVSGWSPGLFREKVLGERSFDPEARQVDSKEDVVAQVAANPWAVGFTGLGESLRSQGDVGLVQIVSEGEENATYALSRPLFLYTVDTTKPVARLLDFVLSPEAQQLILDVGYYPAALSDTEASVE